MHFDRPLLFSKDLWARLEVIFTISYPVMLGLVVDQLLFSIGQGCLVSLLQIVSF